MSKLMRQQQALERQEARKKRSHKDQLAYLDSKFGKDVGAKKEREKLLALINKKEEISDEEKPKKKKKKKDE